MKIQQIRNATNKITYGGKTFLVDPWLAAPYSLGCLDDTGLFKAVDPVKGKIPMPLFPLPRTIPEILSGVDAYIITHLHPDHIDMDFKTGELGKALDHRLPLFAQNEADASMLRASGFQDVRILDAAGSDFEGIELTKTPALHGTIRPSSAACGVVFQSKEEKTLYVAGDTVWFESVRETLKIFHPAVITLNACAAELAGYGRLIMNDEDVETVYQSRPEAQLFLTHFDNVAHASITRQEMKGLLTRRGVTNYVIPEDGEAVEF